jgi:regulator of sirC expression with transglutaminase-like and TPR domain
MSAATRERLALLVAEDDFDPAEANLLVCAEAGPGLDMDGSLAHVEGLTQAAREDGVAAVLREQGFRGATDDYDDPRHSLLSEVLPRRRGLPIALSALALAVARRVGAPMAGIGLPGHFVVADLSGPGPVYIDPFGGWRRIDPADCAALVERTTGLAFRAEFLAPVSGRAILTRTLLNLRGSYLRRRRLDDALWTVELALIVAPDDGALVLGSVVLLTGAGRYGQAAAAATAFLDAHPGDPAVPALEAQLQTLSELRRRMN